VSLGKLIGLIAFILSLYILWQIREILLLVFAAIVLATALNRFVKLLIKSGMRRAIAVLASVALLLLFFIGFFWLIVPPFVDQFQQLLQLLPTVIDRVDAWSIVLSQRLPDWMTESLANIDNLTRQLQPLVNQLLSRSVAFFSNSLAVLLKLLLVLVLTLMLLADPAPYRWALIQLFPSFYRQRANQILDRCNAALGAWLVGILFNMSVITLLSCLGLWILGVPLALAHGGLAGFLAFIPNIGPTLSVIPPMAIALIDSPWQAVAVLILYIAIQQFESNFLTPYVMAHQVSLLPAVTLTAQVIFATFFGFLGLLLALPLTVVCQVWLQEAVVKDVLDRWRSRSEKGLPEAPIEKHDDLLAEGNSVQADSEPSRTPPQQSSGNRQ
jgi:predicted PurR-regulated permease PerM